MPSSTASSLVTREVLFRNTRWGLLPQLSGLRQKITKKKPQTYLGQGISKKREKKRVEGRREQRRKGEERHRVKCFLLSYKIGFYSLPHFHFKPCQKMSLSLAWLEFPIWLLVHLYG